MFKILYGFVLGGLFTYLIIIALLGFRVQAGHDWIIQTSNVISGYVYELMLRHTAAIPFPHSYFFPETTSEKGVVVNNPEKSWGEYTVFVSADKQVIKIIDRKGQEVFSWDASLSRLWPESEQYIFKTIERNFLDKFEAGNIYVLSGSYGPYFGVVKLDKHSNILWKYKSGANHFVDQLEDGSLLILVRETSSQEHSAVSHIEPPFYEDYIAQLNRDGEELKKVSLLDAFQRSDYAGILKQIDRQPDDAFLEDGDLLHPNTITYIPDYAVGTAPMLTPDSVLLSFRNIDVLAVFNLKTDKITWASYGPWKGQHHPTFLENGHLMLFDNHGNLGPGGASRILEVDLNDLSVQWEYTGTKETPFYSRYNGMIQILPNKNILVTETNTGRIFEITREKEIVWDYYVPERYDFLNARRIPSVFNAIRLSKDQAFWER